MTPHQFIAVVVRLFAIWYAIFLIKELPPSFITELEHTGAIVPIKVGIALFLVLLGLLLWFAANPIARLIVPRPETETPLPWTEKRLLTIGSSIVGLWVMLYALSPLIYYGTLWFLSSKNQMPGWETGHTISLMTAFVVFALGVWLFVGARGLWLVWSRLRGRVEN